MGASREVWHLVAEVWDLVAEVWDLVGEAWTSGEVWDLVGIAWDLGWIHGRVAASTLLNDMALASCLTWQVSVSCIQTTFRACMRPVV